MMDPKRYPSSPKKPDKELKEWKRFFNTEQAIVTAFLYLIQDLVSVIGLDEAQRLVNIIKGANMCNTTMDDMEELIHALEMGKPDYDGEDVNYDVATIEDAIKYLKQYAEIKKVVDEFYRKTNKGKSIETSTELQVYLKELASHERCLANQVLSILGEVD